MTNSKLLLGLDIGGTKIAVLAVDMALQVQGRFTYPTDTTNQQRLVNSIVTAVNHTLDIAGATKEQIGAVGIGIPGLVNRHTGHVQMAVNLNLEAYPLGEVLAAAFAAPTVLENDVRMAAVGAFQHLRQLQAINHSAYLSIGTGISAGVILDGKLHRGAHGMAGEIGHIIVEPNGPLCGCGARGCLETFVAGPGIARQWLKLQPDLKEHEQVTAVSVFDAAKQNHPIAQQVIQNIAYHLARAIQWLIMTYDVEKVILGGGVTRAGAALLDPILIELANLRAQSSLAQMMLPDDKVTLLPADVEAATWGAILLAQEAQTENG